MITFGFNTLAMLTYGLGIGLPWGGLETRYLRVFRLVGFVDKPSGVAIEETEGTAMGFEKTSPRIDIQGSNPQLRIRDRR